MTPSRNPFVRYGAVVLLALACALAGPARAAEGREPGRPAQPAGRWWTALHDPALDLLLADGVLDPGADLARQLALQARAVSLYLDARLYAVRLQMARALRELAERQWATLGRQGQGGPDLAHAAALLREATERERALTGLRSESIAGLAETLVGRSAVQVVASMLEPAAEDGRVPVPDFELPDAVAGLVLRKRPDVMAAEAELGFSGRRSGMEPLRLAYYLQAISGEIRAADAVPPADGAEGDAEGDAFSAVLRRARRDVAQRLAEVGAKGEAAGAQAAIVHHMAVAYEALLQDLRAGRVAETELLPATRRLLQEQDRLAESIRLANLAWVAFQVSTGGAGQARTSDLLGAVPSDD